MVEDSELKEIYEGPHVLIKKVTKGEITKLIPRIQRKYDEDNLKEL